jgi:ribosomal protein S18 acetylase RimI-like enzyme
VRAVDSLTIRGQAHLACRQDPNTPDAVMQLVHAKSEDVPDIAQLHVGAWQTAYAGIIPAEYLANLSVAARELTWRQVMSSGSSELMLAKDGGQVLGFVSFGACRDPGAPLTAGEIWAIYVAPSHWSAGVGRGLWLKAREKLVEQGFESVCLWVLADNLRAVRFYVAAGFVPDLTGVQEIELGGRRLREVRYSAALT